MVVKFVRDTSGVATGSAEFEGTSVGSDPSPDFSAGSLAQVHGP